jgi:predicted metal-dependent peptidase
MKFTKVMGNINSSLVMQAEEKLSQVFLDLGVKYDNRHVGTGMGGDPLIFSLLYPVEHICTMSIPTAATDGKRFYWNPKFVLKQSKIGLRIICGHEAWHALYMHPQRRGSRLPKLWNIAVDYIVNGTVMDDFKARQMDAKKQFKDHLGRFMGLNEYAELIKNPFAKIKGFEDLNPADQPSSVSLPAPNEDRDLTPEEQQELEKREKKSSFFFADPDLEDEMKRPEKIYEFLYNLLPKCSKCGRVGMYSPPKDKNQQNDKSQKSEDSQQGKDQGDSDDQQNGSGEGDQSGQCQHDHQNQDSCNSSSKGCDECSGGIDVFGLGGTVDEHMDTEESEEKLAKKISDAMEAARKMAGIVPASLEDELGKLTAPKVTWQDIIRTRILRARSGNNKNDWTKFKTRPMFSGLLVPKRKNQYAHFGCLLDTSGSMSKEDIAFGISQLQSLDERSEGTVTPADSQIYWDKSTKIKKCSQEELNKIKVVGRGGTLFSAYLSDYEKHIGKCDFLIIITDGYLMESDLIEMKNPGVDVIWIITSGIDFKAPFGRVFSLRD